MKIVFLVDNIPAIEMFLPIIRELAAAYEVLVVNYYGGTEKGREEVDQTLQEWGLKTIEGQRLHDVEKLLQEEAPSVVVLSRDTTTTLEQSFIEYANSEHIPTLLVPHGIWAPEERRIWTIRRASAWIKHFYALGYQGLRVIRTGGFSWGQLIRTGLFWMKRDLKRRPVFDGHGGCSNIAVFGDDAKELLVSEGISPAHITVTGNPKFDLLYLAKENGSKLGLGQRWGISSDRDIVLLLTDYLVESGIWTVKQRKQFVRAIVKAVDKLPRCKLVIKIHPLSENESDYLEITKDIPEPPLICKDASLPELLNACSVAITLMSTAGLEAMAMGKPLVVVNLFDNITPWSEASGVVVVRREDDILPVLQTVLYEGLSDKLKESANKYVYQQAYIQDGKAASRIANLIIQLSHGSRRP